MVAVSPEISDRTRGIDYKMLKLGLIPESSTDSSAPDETAMPKRRANMHRILRSPSGNRVLSDPTAEKGCEGLLSFVRVAVRWYFECPQFNPEKSISAKSREIPNRKTINRVQLLIISIPIRPAHDSSRLYVYRQDPRGIKPGRRHKPYNMDK